MIQTEKDALAGLAGEPGSVRTSQPTSRGPDDETMRTPFDRSSMMRELNGNLSTILSEKLQVLRAKLEKVDCELVDYLKTK